MANDPIIALRGVRVHNLRSIDVDIPLGKLTAVTGVSGAGKSSLVFDTLFAEAQRRYLQSFSVAIRQQLESFDQPDAERIGDLCVAVAIRKVGAYKSNRATVGSLTEISEWLRRLVARAGTVYCPGCRQSVQPASVEDVCAAIQLIPAGRRLTVAFPSRPEANQDIAGWTAALREDGFVRLQIDGAEVRLGEQPLPALRETSKVWVLVDRLQTGGVAVERLRDSLETAFARGDGRLALLTDAGAQSFDRRWRCPRCERACPEPNPRLFDCDDPLGACPRCHGSGSAPDAPARRAKVRAESDHLAAPCPACHGQRWNDDALDVRLHGKNIAEVSTLSLDQLADFLEEVPARAHTEAVRDQLRRRLKLLVEIDLGYLHLLRRAATLAAGEWLRIQLAAALTNHLVGALYLLDEPSAGLHPCVVPKLSACVRQLCDAGSSVVMVEHHADFIRAADYIIDLGPGAGADGGRVVAQGSLPTITAAADSVTGAYLSGQATIAVPGSRRPPRGWLNLHGATANNLRNVSVDFPLGVLCAVTGMSGAGKRSLVLQTFYRCLAKIKSAAVSAEPTADARLHGAGQITEVLLVDQEPLPRTARSNAATYLKIFDEIRALFAATADAKIRGFGAGHFSFNQPGGRCDACEGQGTLTVDLQFLADVAMTCPECQGARFKKDILNVRVRSLNVAEVLNLTVREAFRFFRAQRAIESKLKWLLDVGLEYLRLGQATDTLAGGECQRLKLAGHLASSRKPRALFILVEPSIGLHPADVQRLLDCFDSLLHAGHSLLLIEHSLDVIKCADYVIDLGPGAGVDGGQLVAHGTPEQVAQVAASPTGVFLRNALPK